MDKKVISILKGLSIDMINKAEAGHPGISISSAPILYTLFSRHLIFNPKDTNWINRDKFIMSPGHGSALLYITLFLSGYDISTDDLRNYRQINSKLTGHPEYNKSIGVETTTGLAGTGFATSLGFAIAEKYYENNISSELFNNKTYCLVSDEDLMEGISYETASLAGSLKLNNLIVLYDKSNITLDGSIAGIFEDDIAMRFKSMNWNVINIADGENIIEIDKAITLAKLEKTKPTIIICNTIIGKDLKNENTSMIYSGIINEEDLNQFKEKLGISTIPFHVSKDAALYFRKMIADRNTEIYNEWVTKYNNVIVSNSSLKRNLISIEKNNIKINLKEIKINFKEGKEEELNITNQKLMDIISEVTPLFIGGCADVRTLSRCYNSKNKDFNTVYGKNINYGVRENLMSNATNGLYLSGLKPYCNTFLTFSDFLKPGLRLGSMMNLGIANIFTHDTVLIDGDGQTHAPIEQLGMIRSIPNMTVFRPCDVNELLGCWDYIINNNKPVSLILTKEKTSQLKGSSIEDINKGAYIIKEGKLPLNGIIIATGTEVHTAIKVSKELDKENIHIRVISMPSIELFNLMGNDYKESLLPIGIKVIALELSNDSIWNSFVYNKKYLLTLNSFSYSGKKEDILTKLEFDYENIKEKIKKLLK